MTRIAFVACISLWTLACNEPASFASPTPTPQNSPTFSLPPTSQEPTPPITRTVSVGEVVSDRLASNCGSSAACAAVWQARFQLTAPTDGTLVVRVNWDPDYWDTYLKLRIGDRVVSSMEGIPSSDVCTSLRDRRTCSTLASRRLDHTGHRLHDDRRAGVMD